MMLTNAHDMIRGPSRSPNIVPFDMLGMLSHQCSIVTLSLKCTVSEILDFKKCHDGSSIKDVHKNTVKINPPSPLSAFVRIGSYPVLPSCGHPKDD